jgi:hypothetical protein
MVRDREIVQNSVLKMLGWRILKIWTLDWWENSDAVLESIEEALNTERKDAIGIEAAVPSKNGELKSATREDVLSPTEDSENNMRPYQISALRPLPYGGEEFFYPDHRNTILNQIREVMEKEAPISKSLLCKRVLAAWGILRLGQRLDSYINKLLLSGDFYVSHSEDLAFYWLNEEQYLQYDIFRTGMRDAVDLPPEEVANAMKYILTDEISLPTTNLSRLSSQFLGFARSGSNVDAAMHRGMKKAVDRGYLKIENGRAVII